MVDYYAILSRANETVEADDSGWRRDLYDRARRTLASEMRARRPQPTQAEITRELMALEAAIRRIEAERARSEDAQDDSVTLATESDQPPLLESWRSRRPVLVSVALVVAALCAGAYVFWSDHRAASVASRAPAKTVTATVVRMTRDGDIPPA